ncbi:hypothetical protein pb186bvf_008493 [Paramecium bursaria]
MKVYPLKDSFKIKFRNIILNHMQNIKNECLILKNIHINISFLERKQIRQFIQITS